MSIPLENLRQLIKQELPRLIEDDKELQALVMQLSRQEFANKVETESRFDRVLNELRRDREAQTQKWEEQNRKWDENNQRLDREREEQNRKWDENNQRLDREREEQNRKWDEQNRKWDEQNRKWDEQNRKWDENNQRLDREREEQNRKWDEQNEKFEREMQRLHEEIMTIATRHDRAVGALGARWGISSEETFRQALAGILEKSFNVQVRNVTEYDAQGEVFGRPDQVELDVIIHNSVLILCEIKSSIDKAGMYVFERKARFYEKRHQCKADRLLVISPMIDPRAREVGKKLGLELFTDSSDVKTL